jgi:hypothetical protein
MSDGARPIGCGIPVRSDAVGCGTKVVEIRMGARRLHYNRNAKPRLRGSRILPAMLTLPFLPSKYFHINMVRKIIQS